MVEKHSLWADTVPREAWLVDGISVQRSRCLILELEEAQTRGHRVHAEHGPVPGAFVQCTNLATVCGSPE